MASDVPMVIWALAAEASALAVAGVDRRKNRSRTSAESAHGFTRE
jgi:hypothetical protein